MAAANSTPPRRIVYRGQTFYLHGRYYNADEYGKPALHRQIWIDQRGPIPKGGTIHHIDHNPYNNRIKNLRLMTHGAHSRMHMTALMRQPQFRARALAGQKRAILKAVAWHRSAIGRAWHQAHGKRTWKGRTRSRIECIVCGRTRWCWFPTRTRFCSSACAQRDGWRRKSA